eukprot:7749249-Alexandrium_andersonii.AAC.1
MSASLVGSEMCIRDSLCIKGLRLAAPRRAQGECAKNASIRRGGEHIDACLLYTSDAADDM